jgi:FAD/FMN-containing dehydrogenase
MIRSLGGAFGRVPVDATAFAHRGAEALLISVAFLPSDAPAEAAQRVHDLWASLPGLSGTYGNFSSGAEVAAAMYPPATIARLAEIKGRYDPGNLFSRNHNVLPRVAS